MNEGLLLDRESATHLYVASTVEKFGSDDDYRRAWNRWGQASERIYRDAALTIERGYRDDPRCVYCHADRDAAHAVHCPSVVYAPRPGGNPQAGSLLRDLVERIGEDAFAFDEIDGVLHAVLRLTPERYCKLAESDAELLVLAAAERSELALGARNLLLNEGITELWTLAVSTGATKWDSTNAFLGVGTSSTAAAATDTGLIGTTDYQGMVATYPSITSQTAKWKGSYGSGVAEFAWNEWSVCNTNANSGKNLNRKVETLGTKPAGVVWTLEVQITLS